MSATQLLKLTGIFSLIILYILQFNLNVTVGCKPVGYFTSVAKDLNSRLLTKKRASGKGGT